MMFHSASAYPDMTAVALGNTSSYHQAANAANTPVYVPSNRALTHSQYGAHAANFASAAQNGWPTDSFGKSFKHIMFGGL
jgi:GATA-binding protein 4